MAQSVSLAVVGLIASLAIAAVGKSALSSPQPGSDTKLGIAARAIQPVQYPSGQGNTSANYLSPLSN